jgi:chitinase
MSILCRKSTGIVTDWECPSADDRGGSDRDGKNYVDLMKELREAINTSGRDYIVTFTAPSSYWYLRHFDLKGMEAHVDWINLVSYDLHGVWDSDNPIGNQVLSHTNLTEIDYALDLISVTGTLVNYLAPLTDTRTLSVLARWR